MKPAINIIQACTDKALFASWFKDPKTWAAWFVILKAIFGLEMSAAELAVFTQYTGRVAAPAGGFIEAWLIIGRRGGKSRILALVAVFLATFVNWAPHLSPGEVGVIVIIATDRRQARVIFKYIRALLKVPMLTKMVKRETDDAIDLRNNLRIEIQTASFRSVRGHTILVGLCDEISFWRSDETSANPDREILDALRPAMATIPGARLLCASSPYAQRGTLHDAFRKHYGGDGPVLVWKAPTRVMNPTVSQRVIDEAYERDPASAAAEFGAEFRIDGESHFALEAVEAAIVPGRRELLPASGVSYVAFVDPAGGSGTDSMVLAVAHRDKNGCAILDAVRERRPKFSPTDVVAEFSALLKTYRIQKIVGDHWGGEFVREPFRSHGIDYTVSDNTTSDIYRDTLPMVNSGKVELLELPRLTTQLCRLERTTSRSGKDTISHPKGHGQHDDIANAVCGALLLAASRAAQTPSFTPELMARVRAAGERRRAAHGNYPQMSFR